MSLPLQSGEDDGVPLGKDLLNQTRRLSSDSNDDGLTKKKRKLSLVVTHKAVRNAVTGRFETGKKKRDAAQADQTPINDKPEVKNKAVRNALTGRFESARVRTKSPRMIASESVVKATVPVPKNTTAILPDPGTMFAYLYRGFWYVVIIPDQEEIHECMRVHEQKKNNNYHYNSNNAEFNVAKNKNIKSTVKNCFVRFLGETLEMRSSHQSSVLNRNYIYINLSNLMPLNDEDFSLNTEVVVTEGKNKGRKTKITLFIYDPFTWNELVEKPDFDSDFDSIMEAESLWTKSKPLRENTKKYFLMRHPGRKLPKGFRGCELNDYVFPDYGGEETKTEESAGKRLDEEQVIQSPPLIIGHSKSPMKEKGDNDDDLVENLLLLKEGVTHDSEEGDDETEIRNDSNRVEQRLTIHKKKFRNFSDAHPESWARFNRRIDVYWPIDEKWYRGTIVKFFRKSCIHVIKYDIDGEEEALDLINRKEVFRWLDEDGFAEKKEKKVKPGPMLKSGDIEKKNKPKFRYRDLEAVLTPPPQPSMQMAPAGQDKNSPLEPMAPAAVAPSAEAPSAVAPSAVEPSAVVPLAVENVPQTVPMTMTTTTTAAPVAVIPGQEGSGPLTFVDGDKHLHIHASLANLHTHLHIHTEHTHIHIHSMK